MLYCVSSAAHISNGVGLRGGHLRRLSSARALTCQGFWTAVRHAVHAFDYVWAAKGRPAAAAAAGGGELELEMMLHHVC